MECYLIMPFEIITLPFMHERQGFSAGLLNDFCLNKKIISYHTEFFNHQNRPYWTVFLEYEPILEQKTDPTADLTGPEQLLYQRLREWRKEKAEAQGLPVYIICTNQQLADIVKNKPQTHEALKMIKGFGKKKMEKLAADIIKIITTFYETKHE